MKERITWVDVAKCFGMYAIYLGHMGDDAGRARSFVFLFHVILFFFLSGCMAAMSHEEHAGQYILKKAKGVLLPFYFFVLMSVVYFMLAYDTTLDTVKELLWGGFANGAIRNHYFSGSLWFLSCLFVIEAAFALLRKLGRIPLLLVSTATYCVVTQFWAPHTHPQMFYNVDSALCYQFFFVLGYVLFPSVRKLLELNTAKKKAGVAISCALCLVYAVNAYFGQLLFLNVENAPFGDAIYQVICAMLIIWPVLVAARLCQNVALLGEIGRNTLYLCGAEYVIKLMVPEALSIVGLSYSLPSPMAAKIYAAVLLLIANRWFVPFERKALNAVVRAFGALPALKKPG